MTRKAAVSVRVVGAAELESTRAMWEELAAEAEGTHALPAPTVVLERIRARMQECERSVRQGRGPTYRLAVAADEAGELVGLVSIRIVDLGPLVTGGAALVDVVHVRRGHRRAGVGRALVEEVARFAAAAGVEEVSVHVPTGARDAHRFYSGWGFAPLTTRRGVPLATLSRRIGADPGVTAADLTQLQRLLRRRAVMGSRVPRPARSVAR